LCYLGLALVGFLGLLKRPRALLGLFLALILICVVSLTAGWNLELRIVDRLLGSPLLWVRILPLFTAGIVFAVWKPRIPLNDRLAAVALAALVLGAVLPYGLLVAMPTAGAYLLFWLGHSTLVRLHNFGRYGDFSYGTYVYAFPIQQLLVRWHGGAMNPYLLFALATPAAVAAGVISWYAVERHFLKPRGRGEKQKPAVTC
jgi:peptidoglycan/LPS O-acetylase OafA/YrhL